MNEAAAREAFDRALSSYSQDFGTFFLARLLGLDITYPGETCHIAFPVVDFLNNPQGTLHGGIIATILDISMGHLLHRSYGASGATLEMKTQYLQPIGAGVARCEARFLQKGKGIAFLESRMFDRHSVLCVVATSTWKVLRGDAGATEGGATSAVAAADRQT